MLRIAELKVRSLDVDSIEVSWTAPDSGYDPLDYRFEVLRSESPEGPFDPVTGPFEDRYLFVDRQVPTGDKFRKLWYRIRVTEKASSRVETSAAASQQAEPDLIATYIRRQEMTLFTRHIGRQVWLFKVRTFGPRCRSCWDATMGKRTREGCADCFDTGFLRGYHNPIEVYVQIDPAMKAQQNNASMIQQVVMTSGRMSFYPEVVPGDILVELENKRWRVQKVETTERLRATIQQILTLQQIESTDIEYRLPIRLEDALRDIQPSPAQMFDNATDLNSAIENKTPNIFAAYATFPRNPEE